MWYVVRGQCTERCAYNIIQHRYLFNEVARTNIDDNVLGIGEVPGDVERRS